MVANNGRACLAVAFGMLAACSDPSPARHDAAGVDDTAVDTGPGPVTTRSLDLLFVIDNGPSMADKYTNLLNNIPNFMNVLESVQGGLPNVHIGVITTDLGTRGSLDSMPGAGIGNGAGSCTGTGHAGNLRTHSLVDGRYIVDVELTDGTRRRNYTGSLAQAFNGLAAVGVMGCGFEQPLEAAKLALSPQNVTNAGFVRDYAKLAIIIIDDEDDCSVARTSFFGNDTATLGPIGSFRCNRFGHTCSQGGADSNQMNQVGTKGGCTSNEASAYLTRVTDYVAHFRGLKADPLDVIVGIIAAPTTPYEVELRTPSGGGTATPAIAHSCSFSGANGIEVGDPAVRLVQFANGFPNRSTVQTICQQDLSGALTQIAQLFATP